MYEKLFYDQDYELYMYDLTVFIVLISLLVISAKYVFHLQKKIEEYRLMINQKSRLIEKLSCAKKEIEQMNLQNSHRYESFRAEISDLIDIVIRYQKSGVCDAILKHEKEKQRANSAVGNLIIEKIRNLNTPRPPNKGPEFKAPKYVVDRQELKERDPTH